jgi:hypothetical protein
MTDGLDQIIAEMSGKVTERQLREAEKAKRTAQQEAQAEEDAYNRRSAIAMLEEKEKRDLTFYYDNLGSLSDGELRRLIRKQHGFEPI